MMRQARRNSRPTDPRLSCYLHQQDRLWIPKPAEEIDNWAVLRWTSLESCEIIGVARKAGDGFNEKTFTGGFVIPTTSLESNRKFQRTWEEMNSFELSVVVALLINHNIDLPSHLRDTMSPLLALDSGQGQCIHRASVLAALCRIFGMPARIVGDNHFFEGTEIVDPRGQSHWWVEVYEPGGWVVRDPTIHPDFLAAISKAAKSEGIGVEDFDRFAISMVVHAISEHNIRVVFPTTDPRFDEKRENRIIAAEIDLPVQ